ncbi:MAG: hypothetical protein ACRDDP_01340, partial [Plesiomonas sp.]
AELAALSAVLGRLPEVSEYLAAMQEIDLTAADTYRYLNFNQLSDYTQKADNVIFQVAL